MYILSEQFKRNASEIMKKDGGENDKEKVQLQSCIRIFSGYHYGFWFAGKLGNWRIFAE